MEVLRSALPRARPSGDLFREHGLPSDSADGGCWWFSCSGEGRFDLEDPLGTCYLAETEGVAVRERCGRIIAMGLPVPESVYADRVVSRVSAPELGGDGADLTAADALRAGITGELSATSEYVLTRQWADALWDAGFEALRYAARFTPGGREAAWAVFGRAGAQECGTVRDSRPLREVLHELGHPVLTRDALSEGSLDVQDGAEA